jgi:hypothetical protein
MLFREHIIDHQPARAMLRHLPHPFRRKEKLRHKRRESMSRALEDDAGDASLRSAKSEWSISPRLTPRKIRRSLCSRTVQYQTFFEKEASGAANDLFPALFHAFSAHFSS